MTKGAIVLVLAIGVIAGCEPNEISFFIEHVKAQPDAPECSVTESDEYMSSGALDVAFRNAYNADYLVTNQLMAREDYGNGIAESNGIFIDGMETYVRDFTGGLTAPTVYYEFEFYVESENSQVATGVMIPAELSYSIAVENGCPEEDGYVEWLARVENENTEEYYGSYYSVARFIGHSAGGYDVMTPEFSFPISICCGCLIDWSSCKIDTPCSMYCEEPEDHGMCVEGVFNGGSLYDCRRIFYNPSHTWPAAEGEVCGDPDPTMCDCSDCEAAN